MSCEYCGGNIEHHPRCPNYISPKASHYCSVCNDGILNGERYIESDNGECRHFDCCIWGTRELIEWLGYEIKTIGD